MWFASIWIFTLGYNWQSGANFFEKNLLDFCPASNTLGWRWVAGLQTINKPYLAKSNNIQYFTNGRFYPKGQLNENVSLSFPNPNQNKTLTFKEPKKVLFDNNNKLGIILNKNDLSLNQIFDKKKMEYDCCLYLVEHKNKLINIFQKKIFNDILKKNKRCCFTKNFNDIFQWLILKKIKNLVLPYETVGNKIFNDNQFISKLNELNINYMFFMRDWDRLAFPHATKGFFKFKKNIPDLINLADI
jgi:Deoxyribodipyrimidine photolyase